MTRHDSDSPPEARRFLVRRQPQSWRSVRKRCQHVGGRPQQAVGLHLVGCRNHHATEDIYQEVVLAAMSHTERNEGPWARGLRGPRRAARLRAIDWLRREKRQPRLLDGAVLDLLEEEWRRLDAERPGLSLEALQHCVMKLTDYARQLIRLRYVDGLSGLEVSRRLGRSPHTVYVALGRTYRNSRSASSSRCPRRKIKVRAMISPEDDNPLREDGESEFLGLVCRYLDDQATPEEWAGLVAQLREDPARRQTFVRFCFQAKLIAEAMPASDLLLSDSWEESGTRSRTRTTGRQAARAGRPSRNARRDDAHRHRPIAPLRAAAVLDQPFPGRLDVLLRRRNGDHGAAILGAWVYKVSHEHQGVGPAWPSTPAVVSGRDRWST